MNLIISEKKEVGIAISEYFKKNNFSISNKSTFIEIKDYGNITWAIGHLLTLKEPSDYNPKYSKYCLDDLPIFFEKWEHVPVKSKERQLNTIKALLTKSDEIIHAGDPDDEGQYIIDEILMYFKNKKPVKRILINDNNRIDEAFENIKDNKLFEPLFQSALERSIADFMFGTTFSRLYSLLTKQPVNVGRVMTPTAMLVINRDNEIENHISEKVYSLKATFEANAQTNTLLAEEKEFIVNRATQHIKNPLIVKECLNRIEELYRYIKTIDSFQCTLTFNNKINENELEATLNKLNSIFSNNWNFDLIVSSEIQNIEPPLLFNLTQLQSYINKKYGYSAQETLRISQDLRDKYNAITYNRSDCQYLHDKRFNEAENLIKIIRDNLKETNFNSLNTKDKPRCFNSNFVSAHHGIIPTETTINLSLFSEKEKNVYKEIAKRYLLQFTENHIKSKKTFLVQVNKDFSFSSSFYEILNMGFKEHLNEKEDKELEEDNIKIDKNLFLIPNGIYKSKYMKKLETSFMMTKPKKRYDESELILDMSSISKYVKDNNIKKLLKEKDKGKEGENGGIGTVATRGEIIEKLIELKFLERKKRQIISTELGRKILNLLSEKVKTIDTTAHWYVIQENLKERKVPNNSLVYNVLSFLKEVIKEEKNRNLIVTVEKEIIGYCPRCKKPIYENTKAYYCSNYKNGCSFSLFKEQKFYGKLTKTNAKNLLQNKQILLNVEGGNGKSYKAYYKIEDTGKFVNLKFVKRKEEK